jgi:hypothetical protein
LKFYSIDPAVEEAIAAGKDRIRLKVEIDYRNTGEYEAAREADILEAVFTSAKEAAGGTASRGEIILDNRGGEYSGRGGRAGSAVDVSFSVGNGRPFARRFALYVDEAGFRELRGPGSRRRVRIALGDLSYALRKTDEARDWRNPVVFAYVTVCDKTQAEQSLVHLAAKRAGLTAADIDCSTIVFGLPYVRLERNLWAELSELATAYRCHLECAIEKPLVFAHSPYQLESEEPAESSYRFHGGNLFFLRSRSLFDEYRNTVRLRFNRPVSLPRGEIWRYEDPPVVYDANLVPSYPFRLANPRAVSGADYAARYRVREAGGTERAVVYTDQVDDLVQASGRLGYSGGPLGYTVYDTTSYRDRAILRIEPVADAELRTAAIHGRPIVYDLNCSAYVRDESGIARYGTRALNSTGGFFSSDPVNGKAQYEDWAERELAYRLRERRLFTCRMNRPVFHARVGAAVTVAEEGTETAATIRSMELRYRKREAFVASFNLEEA